jgi:hypothetical protein
LSPRRQRKARKSGRLFLGKVQKNQTRTTQQQQVSTNPTERSRDEQQRPLSLLQEQMLAGPTVRRSSSRSGNRNSSQRKPSRIVKRPLRKPNSARDVDLTMSLHGLVLHKR